MARISTGTMTVAIFAVLFGLVGAYALRAALVGDAPEPPAPPRTTNVPLAAHDLPAGRRITVADMVLVPMTQADMEKRGLPLDKTMLGTEQIVGRVLHDALKPGDGFLTTNLYPEGSGPKLADKLKPGMRAMTIAIDNLAAVGGSTVEGSFVDVIFRAKERPADFANNRPLIPATTVTLLENVEVLSVDRANVAASRGGDGTLDVRGRGPSAPTTVGGANFAGNPVVSVTIAVTPDQANVVKAVIGQGDMSLSLRSDKGAGNVSPNKYTIESILGVKNPQVAGLDRIEIFRGGWQRQNVQYQNDKLVREEVSLIPGISPSTKFPLPATIPPASTMNIDSPNQPKPTNPQPNIYSGNGGSGSNYGGYGSGMGWGNGWGAARGGAYDPRGNSPQN